MRTAYCFALVWLALPAGAGVWKVTGPEGEVVVGARVAVYSPPLSNSLAGRTATGPMELHSGEAGEVAGELPAVTPRLVFVDHAEYSPLVLVASTREPLQLRRGVFLTGQVLADPRALAEGRVCARWRIVVESWGRSLPVERCGPLGAEGKFSLGGLGQERADLEVTAPGFLPARTTWRSGEPPLRLELERGFSLRGRVLDPLGHGVAEARVEAASLGSTESDEDGRFEIAVRSFPVDLKIAGEGLRTTRQQVARTDTERAFRLEWGQQVSGQVRLEDGSRPDRVVLVAERRSAAGVEATERFPLRLESQGEFRVELEEPGLYHLRLKVAGYREVRIPEALVSVGAALDLGALLVTRGAGVRCRVVDEATGDPVPGVELTLLAQGSGVIDQLLRGARFSGVSREDGTVEVYGLDPGRYEARFRHDRYAPKAVPVEIEADRLTDAEDVALNPGVELYGEILSRAGRRIPGARVQLFETSGLGIVAIAEGVADGAGAYRGLVVSPGRYLARVSGPHLQSDQTIEIAGTDPRERHDLTLPGVRLELTLSRAGEPVEAGAFVSVSAESDPGHRGGKVVIRGVGELAGQRETHGVPASPRSVRTLEPGLARLDDVPVGPARIEVVFPDGSVRSRHLVVPDVAVHRAELELASPGLLGRVTLAGAVPLVPVRAQVFDSRGLPLAIAETDVDGTFTLDGLEPGRYSLRVEATGYRAQTLDDLTLPPEGRHVEIDLEEAIAGSLDLRLARADGTALVSAAVVLLGPARETVRALWTDGEGHLELADLSPARYDLVWSDPGIGTGAQRAVEITAGKTTNLTRTLAGGADVTLQCAPERCSGRALEDLRVTTHDGIELTVFLGSAARQRQFDDTGVLALGRLSAGSYEVTARTGEFLWRQAVKVYPGQPLLLPALEPEGADRVVSP
jgi:Carboxypeptidase regulatory-like domain